MAKSSRRFIPRLEAFDDRCLPSVTCVQSGDTLQVLGDDSANVVTISDNVVIDPVTGERGVVVTGDGQTWTFGSSVARIQVYTYGGNDTVSYSATGDLSASRTLSVDLGTKNDAFNCNMDGLSVGSHVDMVVQVFGQGGGDTVNLSAQNSSVGASGSMVIDLEGGHGKDGLTTNFTGMTVDPTGLFSITQKA
jgi:hypothetical protein